MPLQHTFHVCVCIFMTDSVGVCGPAHLKLLVLTEDFQRCMSEFSQGLKTRAKPTVEVGANGNHRDIMETTEPRVQWAPTECNTCHYYISIHRLSAVTALTGVCYTAQSTISNTSMKQKFSMAPM